MRSHHKKYKINNSGALPDKIKIGFLILILLLVSFTGFSQSNVKKELTANDYPLWSYLKIDKLSENGKWVSYYLHYQNSTDTLFVKNSKGTKTFSFPGATKGEFITERWFLMMSSKEELKIVDLFTFGQQIVQGVLRYDLCADSRNVILLKKGNTGKKQLELKNLESNKSILVNDVDCYWYNSKSDAIVYTIKTENTTTIALLNLHDKTTATIASTNRDCEYSDLVWQNNGDSVAFLERPSESKEKTARTCIRYYIIAERKLYALSPTELDNFPADREIISSSVANLSISEDGKRIFFGLQTL